MLDWKLKLYHNLPPILRDIVASYRGWELRDWRYGPETEQLVAETLERDRWTLGQWTTYQENRLSQILHRAATRIPYYREYWAERKRKGDRSSWENLENWPILEKEPLRKHPHAFVADDRNTRQMYALRTSGTSGTPLQLWWSREATRRWYAMFEARNRRWNNVSWREKWAIMGGQVVVPYSRNKPPFWVHNYPMNQTYLSTHHININSVREYSDLIVQNGYTHIIAYTSSIALLSRLALSTGIKLSGSVKAIITNAEPLFPWQRDVIKEAFGCRVVETYGQAEAVAAASEDPSGYLRFWPESGWLEIIDENNQAVQRGSAGDIIVTHLFNEDMPLIRYRNGDRAAVATQTISTTNNALPIISRIEGRNNDMVVTKDGRQIFWLNPVFYGLPIVEAQIRQQSTENLHVLCVPGDGFDSHTRAAITSRLVERVGNIQIEIETVPNIPRESNGKFRAVISNLSPEAKERHL